MQMIYRVLPALPGLLFLALGLNWILNPASAAEGLGMPLLDGLGRSSQIGDIGGLFVSGAVLMLAGAILRNAAWLQAAALVVGAVAVMRLIAWAFHGAELATAAIIVEIVIATLLLVSATKLANPAP